MHLSRSSRFGITAVLLTASAAWGADAAKNLAPNPDFEQPNHLGWAFQDKAKAGLDKDNPHGGVYSLRQDAVKGERWNCVSMSSNEIVKVEPDKDYYVSVWGRNNLVGGSASIIIRELDYDSNTVKYVYTKVPANQAEWKQYQLVHKPSEKAVGLQIYFYIAPTAESGSAWWDDVTLSAVDPGTKPIQPSAAATPAPAPAQAMQAPKAKKPVVEPIKTGNLAPNPGFELPNHQGWALQENVKASVDADRPHEGNYSLRQEAVNKNRWNCVSMASSAIIKVQPGAIYYVSLWGRNDLVDGDPSIVIREIDDQSKTIRYEYHKLKAGQAEWKQYYLTHRPSEKTTGLQVYLYIAPKATAGAAWWDDVSVTAVMDPFATSSSVSLQMAPLDSSTIQKGEGVETPGILSAWTNAGRDAVGGHLTVRLSKAYANGQTDPTPIWSLDNSKVEREGPRPIQVPVSDLPEGRYQLALNFTNADDTMHLQWNRPVAVIPAFNLPATPEPITRSEIGSDGLLHVNGKPFLSTYFYHNLLDAPTLTMLHKEYGVTTAQVWGGASIDKLVENVDMAYRSGLYSWVVLFHPATFDAKAKAWKTDQLVEAVNRLKNHPGVIGWDLSDEPEPAGIPAAEVRRAADLIRKNDPNHIVMVNLCRESTLAEYGGISDLASYDSYPFHDRELTEMHKWNEALKATTPGKPLLSCLQTWGAIGRGMPTPAQLRAETYYFICDGMTLFHYYSWTEGNHAFGFMNNDSELASCVKTLNHELFQLQPFLFEGKPVKVAVSGADELAHLAKQVGDHVEIVVVNPTARSVEQVRVTLADHPITSAVSRFDNNRQPTITDGAIIDRLPPYGVVIYQVKN